MARSKFFIGRVISPESINNLNQAIDLFANKNPETLPIAVPDNTYLEVAGKFGANVLQKLIKQGENTEAEQALSQTTQILVKPVNAKTNKVQLNSSKYSDTQIYKQAELLGVDIRQQNKLSVSLVEADQNQFIPDDFAKIMGKLWLNLFNHIPNIDFAWVPVNIQGDVSTQKEAELHQYATDIFKSQSPEIQLGPIEIFEK